MILNSYNIEIEEALLPTPPELLLEESYIFECVRQMDEEQNYRSVRK